MTAAERALWQRAEREARKYRPAMQAAILRTWDVVAAGLPIGTLERLIKAGAIEAIASLVAEASGEVLGVRYTPLVRETFASAARLNMARLPSPLAGVRFDLLNPRTVRAALGLETTALGTLTTEVAATVRQVVARGITEGVNPRTVARGLREAIGLAPNQEAAVRNFRAALESGDFASILPHRARATGNLTGGRALRDARFDGTLRRGETLTPAQVDRMTDAYRSRYVALNAETHARTAALDAQRLGQKEAWETALADSDFDRSRVTKRWVATVDSRTREEHLQANGTVVQIDDLYPYDGGVMTPGEGTYNCRCVELIRITIGRAA